MKSQINDESTAANELKRVRKRLSLLLMIIIILIVWTIGGVFFFGRFHLIHYRIEQEMTVQINRLDKWFPKLQNRRWRMQNSMHWINKSFDRPKKHGWMVMISNTWEIMRSNVPFQYPEEIINNLKNAEIQNVNYDSDSYLLYSSPYKQNNWVMATVIYIYRLPFNYEDILYELLLFLFISILPSILIYYISYAYIWKLFIPIQNNINSLEDFTSNASHELKTPLAVMLSNLELALVTKKYPKLIKESVLEIDKLSRLISSLVILSKESSIKWASDVKFYDLFNETIDELSGKIKDKNISINVKIPKKTTILIKEDHLKIVLINLISNAIKYNTNWWKIIIRIKGHRLTITDTWIWISEAEKTRIFERFYQANRSRSDEWFGLGLSIVTKILSLYNYPISVTNGQNKWTSFSIDFTNN